eukprot:1051882-Rhodomonas_salina.1
MRCAVLRWPMGLRCLCDWYAMSSTDMAYGATVSSYARVILSCCTWLPGGHRPSHPLHSR